MINEMKFRLIQLFAPACAMCLIGVVLPQAGAQSKPQMAEQVFKNVQVLKGIPVDDFLGTMGLMSAGIGFDCSECHDLAGTAKVDWAADNNPKKVIARRMVTMVENINKSNFGNAKMVSCWTCHRGRDIPETAETLDKVYGPGPEATDDVITQAPDQPPATQILDKYIQAVGGAQKLATLTSWVGKGVSVGFGGLGGGGRVTIYSRSPAMHTQLIEFPQSEGRGTSVRSFDGTNGWIRTPLTVLDEYALSGGELEGARLDAKLAFPGQIKGDLTNWRTGNPTTISDLPGPDSQTGGKDGDGIGKDREVNVVQGSGPKGLVATMYFDKQTGLLLRLVRWSGTPIGKVPVQVDYAGYKDVGGIKFPHRLLFAWLDGRDSIQLNEIQLNVPIDPIKFSSPDKVTGK
jgi:photosynthetic reaction center cytochrome c subunit